MGLGPVGTFVSGSSRTSSKNSRKDVADGIDPMAQRDEARKEQAAAEGADKDVGLLLVSS